MESGGDDSSRSFCGEFSERLEVAKSQRIEVTGGIGISYKRREMDKLSNEELQFQIDTIRNRQHEGMSGEALDEAITKYEEIVASLHKQREGDRIWRTRDRGRFDSARQSDADFEVVTPAGMAHEPKRNRAAVLEAPVVAEGPVLSPEPSATPSVYEDPKPTGIGYDANGLAFRFDERETEL